MDRPWSTVTRWWRELSGPVKYRLYTRLSLQASVLVAAIALMTSGGGRWSAVGLVVAAVGAILALEAQPGLATRSSTTVRRWAVRAAVVILAATWVAAVAASHRTSPGVTTDGARVLGAGTAIFAVLSLMSFSRHRWWLLAGVSLATGLALDSEGGHWLRVVAAVFALGAFVVGTTMLTMWGLRIVEDLERTKDLQADLQLAEERLRFGRDLHDVVGRSFSAIAVKSELAATLSRAGAVEQATTEINQVKAIAVQSMEQMRSLVRGYRDIDLEGEVAGARSLLSATGCRLVVDGEVVQVPAALHEVAAWVVREGTTNIVKHSSATSATLTLGATGMSLRNDGASGSTGERSGLLGLADRLAAHGAALATTATDDVFVLDITWEHT